MSSTDSIEIATGERIGSADWPLMDHWEAGDCHHERFPRGQFTCYGCGQKLLDRSRAMDETDEIDFDGEDQASGDV